MIKKTALAVAALVAGVSAQAADLSVTLDTTYVTDYVFRGKQAGNESIQPSVEATYGDLYVGAWHSSSLSNKPVVAGLDVTETDLYAGYNIKIDDTFSADVGLTRYLYEGHSAGDTTEAFVGIKATGLLSPSLYYYYDFDLEVSTFEASVGYSVPAEAIKASLDFSAKAGNVLTHKSASEDRVYGSVGVAIPYKLAENATLTVGADYIVNDGGEFIDGEADGFVGKLGLSIGF